MISKHFSRSEFACKCGCGLDVVDVELITVLEDAREHFDSPIVITSGARCAWHNMKEGGSPDSLHKIGKAADFIVNGVDSGRVADYLENKYPNNHGIGRYNGRVHFDSRSFKARWDRT